MYMYDIFDIHMYICLICQNDLITISRRDIAVTMVRIWATIPRWF